MPNELRTPHLLHVLPTFVPAGIEMRTVNLIAGFGGDFRHSILSMDGQTDAMDRLPAGAPVRLLPTPEKAGSLRTAARLRQILREEKPDLLLTYNWGAFDALLAARSLGFRRVVHHEDGFNAEEAHSFKRRRILARRALLPWVPRLIVPSARLRDIATRLWKMPTDRVRLVRNGIRLDVFVPGEAPDPELRRELGIPQDVLVVGAVGGLRPVKNFVRLLDACAAAGPDRSPERPLHILIVGEGEERPLLEERAARPDLQGRVHLAGYRSDVHRLYRAMDLFAITSDTEQMPVCLLEAMASGLPVVSTDVGDVKTVLPAEQERWLVGLREETATVSTLAARISELARDLQVRRRLGALNRRRVEERYSFEGMLSAYREIYHEVLCLPDTPGLPAEEVVGVC